MKNQNIYCDVHDCRFNDAGKTCGLESIQVGSCAESGARSQEDSMCCSFREK